MCTALIEVKGFPEGRDLVSAIESGFAIAIQTQWYLIGNENDFMMSLPGA